MTRSNLTAACTRSRSCCMATIALGLLVAGCEQEASDAQTAATATANGSETSALADMAANGSRPYESLGNKRAALADDAVAALDETYSALGLLAREDKEGAAEALARAIGKLEVVLTAQPDLALAPIAVDVRTYDLIADPEDVDALRQSAEKALDERRLQDGRMLIRDLASEHVFSVTSLPLATYPGALRQAAALIENGRVPEAVAMLDAALATLVIQETIVPLPLARAELLLSRARPLAEQAQRSPAEAARVASLLSQARDQLDLARALGYVTRSELDPLYDALKKIEEASEADRSGRGLFDRLAGLFDTANRRADAASEARASRRTNQTN